MCKYIYISIVFFLSHSKTQKTKQNPDFNFLMEMMRDCMRKLGLWSTKTFTPIMTHDELEPIMSTLGFMGLPISPPPTTTASSAANNSNAVVVWKEYAYFAKYVGSGSSGLEEPGEQSPPSPPPRPRLPYPKIDGLHLYTYQAFIDAVNFYLQMCDVSDLFHIRGMPLHVGIDRGGKWRKMEEDESVFVYRDGTIDQTTYSLYHLKASDDNHHMINGGGGGSSSDHYNYTSMPNMLLGNKKETTKSRLVELKEIIV